MSIPLDRLYHYLGNLCSDDIVIYRWYPHGSKKLDDLNLLDTESALPDRFNQLTFSNMICHDQEPLDYNYYSPEECLTSLRKFAEIRKQVLPHVAWCHSEEFLDKFAETHLRVKIKQALNLNDCILLCHSEKNSKELIRYEDNNFIGVYYWCHALIARDWFRYAEHDARLTVDFDSIAKDFLIYNRAWTGTREYRLKFTELLADLDLQAQCNTKFNPDDNSQHYLEHKFKNPNLQIHRQDLDTKFELNESTSSASADYVNKDYKISAIEVVLETLFDDQRHHLTEKALRPIACGRPFILASTPGALDYLKSYGFKTFHGLIDETYDTVADPLDRLKCITNEMHRISNLNRDQKISLWKELYNIAEYNKHRFFSTEFHNQVINEFVENLKSGYAKSQQNVTGKWWNLATSLNDNEPTELEKRVAQWLNEKNN